MTRGERRYWRGAEDSLEIEPLAREAANISSFEFQYFYPHPPVILDEFSLNTNRFSTQVPVHALFIRVPIRLCSMKQELCFVYPSSNQTLLYETRTYLLSAELSGLPLYTRLQTPVSFSLFPLPVPNFRNLLRLYIPSSTQSWQFPQPNLDTFHESSFSPSWISESCFVQSTRRASTKREC